MGAWQLTDGSTTVPLPVQRIPDWAEEYAARGYAAAGGVYPVGDLRRNPAPLTLRVLVDEDTPCAALSSVRNILAVASDTCNLTYTADDGSTLTWPLAGWQAWAVELLEWDKGKGVLRLDLLPTAAAPTVT